MERNKIIFLLFLLIFPPIVVQAKCGRYNVLVSGEIQDSDHHALQFFEIKLRTNINPRQTWPVKTDKQGYFQNEFAYPTDSGMGLFGDRCNNELKWLEVSIANEKKTIIKRRYRADLVYETIKEERQNTVTGKSYVSMKELGKLDLGLIVVKSEN